jgi:hypothetical protein
MPSVCKASHLATARASAVGSGATARSNANDSPNDAANPTPERTRPRTNNVAFDAKAVTRPPANVTSSPSSITLLRPIRSPRLPVAMMLARNAERSDARRQRSLSAGHVQRVAGGDDGDVVDRRIEIHGQRRADQRQQRRPADRSCALSFRSPHRIAHVVASPCSKSRTAPGRAATGVDANSASRPSGFS